MTRFFACLAVFFLLSVAAAQEGPLGYVDPFIGTGGHGHTYPGATTPSGMVQLSPDTREKGWDACGGYHYSDSTIAGFSHTHLSGTGVGDMGDLLMMPSTSDTAIDPGERSQPQSGWRSAFRHSTEKAAPGYYAVELDDYQIRAELTATTRCGMHRYTFPEDKKDAFLLLDLVHGPDKERSHTLRETPVDAQLRQVGDSALAGYRISTGWNSAQYFYFYIRFNQAIGRFGIANKGKFQYFLKAAQEDEVRGAAQFFLNDTRQLKVKVGVSAVSIANAKANLQTEIPGWDFDQVKANTQAEWKKALNKARIEGSEKQKRIFYTAWYHNLVVPNQMADVNGQYRGPNNEILQATGGTYYSTLSLWDTYRATNPLYTILQPEKARDIVRTMLTHHEHYGYLPRWTLWSQETQTMIGNHAIPVIADAIKKGIPGIDQQKAWEAVRISSTKDHQDSPFTALEHYDYIPTDLMNQSVSSALEISYNDWCAAELAEEVDQKQQQAYFRQRSGYYKNLYDEKTRFFRGKTSEGQWRKNWDQYLASYSDMYTEATAFQYNFAAQHDIQGIMNLMGSRQVFLGFLKEVFTNEHPIHGPAAKDATGLIGQYAHGNEPSHHLAYLFNYGGAPYLTQKWVRRILQTQYDDAPDGYAGNEDCGQMSAWYLFSAMGFYPVNPADGRYVIGSPILEEARLDVGEGKTFEVKVKGQKPENPYIKKVKLNGQELKRSYITHQELMAGGELKFWMDDEPNKEWARNPEAWPPSESKPRSEVLEK